MVTVNHAEVLEVGIAKADVMRGLVETVIEMIGTESESST